MKHLEERWKDDQQPFWPYKDYGDKFQKFYVHPDSLVDSSDIGQGTHIWAFCNVMFGVKIGKECNICDNVFLESNVVVGNNTTIKNGVIVWDGATIGDYVFIGPNCSFINELYPRCLDKTTKENFIKTKIGDGATIGANAVIVGGCHIGEHAFVGAGAVVTKPVEPFSMVVGNPAKLVKYICACREKFDVGPGVFLEDHLKTCEIYKKYLNSKK